MTTFYSVLLGVDVLLAMGIIALVLVQHGKGADAGAAFGSGASATVFGARGSTSFLSRATAVLAALFFLNSMGLAYIASHQPEDESVVERISVPAPPVSPPEEQVQEQRPSDLPVDVPEVEALTPEPTDEVESGSVPEDVPLVDESSNAANESAGKESTSKQQ